jgi:hypothetical protein
MRQKDYIVELTKYVNLLHEATFFNYDFMKKQALNQINNKFPDIAREVLGEWRKQYPDEKLTFHNSVFQLTPMGTYTNLDLYLHVINKRINQYYNWSVSLTAVQKIFFQSQPLSHDDVLYTEEDKQLTVSDFLSVLNYGKRFVETYFGTDSTKVSEYVHATQTIDMAINHKEVDKPINKTLHIINDVLMKCTEDIQKPKGKNKLVINDLSLVDLTIGFLVKG